MSDTDFSSILKDMIDQKIPGRQLTSHILHSVIFNSISKSECVETEDTIKAALQKTLKGQSSQFYDTFAKVGMDALEEHRKIVIEPMFM